MATRATATLEKRLTGKCALVTGAARRIGRAIALALGEAGASVVVHHRSSEAETVVLAADLEALGVSAWPLQADLADARAAQELVQRSREVAGGLDIVVNNASIFPGGTLPELDVADVSRNLQVNALSPFLVGRAFADEVGEGSIVNLLDTKIVQYDPKHVAYHLSKRMLFTLTRIMAIEFAPRVRVNAVAPGLILPPPGEDESYLRRTASANPLQRWGSAEQVADAVLFLLHSDFVTGQVIFVDGGQHMKGTMYG